MDFAVCVPSGNPSLKTRSDSTEFWERVGSERYEAQGHLEFSAVV